MKGKLHNMTLDDLFALVRSGEVDLWIIKDADQGEMRQRMADPTFTPETITRMQVQIHIEHTSDREKKPELDKVLAEHALDVYMALYRSETSVCMLPSQHWQSYREVENLGETYFVCDICADDRAQKIEGFLPLLPAQATILDFQAHKKKNKAN